jgi:hypothetical protein
LFCFFKDRTPNEIAGLPNDGENMSKEVRLTVADTTCILSLNVPSLICCVVLLFCCFRRQECAFRNALGYYDVKNVEADVFFCFQNVMSHMVRTLILTDAWICLRCIFLTMLFRFNLSPISWRVIVRWVLLVGVISVFNLKHISKHRHLSKNELFITDLDNSTIGLQGVLNRMMDTIEHQHSELHHHLIQELQLDPKFYGKNSGGWLVWWLFSLVWLLFVVVVVCL